MSDLLFLGQSIRIFLLTLAEAVFRVFNIEANSLKVVILYYV